MTTTEEILVSGDNFIERRIFVSPQQEDIEKLQHNSYAWGYSRGWVRGFLMGLALFGVTALCIWLALQR